MPRLFFALWPNPEVRAQLVLQRDLAAREYRGRPMRADTLHMTLVFLGQTPDIRLLEVVGCADRIRAKSFTLNIDARGHFPAAKVAWLGCTDAPAALHDLQNALRLALERGQLIQRDSDATYQPHITVARDCITWPSPTRMPAIGWRVKDFALVDATHTSDGPAYSVLRRWPLDG